MSAKTVEAQGTEAGTTRLAGHEADARVDLVEIDEIHALVDTFLAAIEEIPPERFAEDANRVDRFGLPVVPVDLGLGAVDIGTHFVEQVTELLDLVDLRNQRDHRYGEEDALPLGVCFGHVLGRSRLRRVPHTVDGRAELVGEVLGHGHRRHELKLSIPVHLLPSPFCFPLSGAGPGRVGIHEKRTVSLPSILSSSSSNPSPGVSGSDTSPLSGARHGLWKYWRTGCQFTRNSTIGTVVGA